MTVTKSDNPFVVDGASRVELRCQVIADDKLALHHGDANLHEYGGVLVSRVAAGSTVELSVADFSHGGRRYRAHCFSIDDAGGLTAWGRASGASVASMSPEAAAELRFVVVGVREDGGHAVVDNYPIVRVDRMGTNQ